MPHILRLSGPVVRGSLPGVVNTPGAPSAETIANAKVIAEAKRRLTDGTPSVYTSLSNLAEAARERGQTGYADELHRAAFGSAVTLTLAQAEALVKSDNG